MPAQVVGEFTVTASVGLIATLTVLVLAHPAALVPATVYVVLAVGVATTVPPLEVFNVLAGLQVYVLAPLALSVAVPVGHTVAALGEMFIVGTGFTVMVTTLEALHPELVPVTV
jgi:hypothetical protein